MIKQFYSICVAALPSSMISKSESWKQVFDREDIMNIVQAQFELPRKKSSSSAHVLVAYGGRGRAGAKRGGKSGGRGGGRNNNGNRSSSQKGGESGAAAGAEKHPAKGPMCFNCHGRGHYARDCTVKLCNRCHGKGHEESSCPSPANMKSVLANEMPGPRDGTIAAASFVAAEVDGSVAAVCRHLQGAPAASGESSDGGALIGAKEALALALQAGEERKSLEAWCFDSGSSGDMSNSCEKIIDFRPCNKFVCFANGTHLPIEGHGNLVEFQSGQNSVRLKLIDVTYVPSLSYHLFSGPACVKQGHTYLGYRRQITVTL